MGVTGRSKSRTKTYKRNPHSSYYRKSKTHKSKTEIAADKKEALRSKKTKVLKRKSSKLSRKADNLDRRSGEVISLLNKINTVDRQISKLNKASKEHYKWKEAKKSLRRMR